MKAVLLAGGLGTRISEETNLKPKPMVEIGGKPILWHIMKTYSHHGINDFVVCCGYKGYVIKEYFANYFLHMSDFSQGGAMITEHASVVLTEDIAASGLQAGDVGVVAHIYRQGAAYEVEFMTLDGGTLAIETLEAGQVREAGSRDVPHVRKRIAA